MGKRIIILALAMLLGTAFLAYAETQNIKVSGDLEFSAILRSHFGLHNLPDVAAATYNPAVDKNSEKFFLGQARVRVDADLTDNVSATVRLLSEWVWGRQGENGYNGGFVDYGDNSMYAEIDLAYVTLKEFLYSPLTLTVGRQELHFGNDMIIGDPDTNRLAHFSHESRIPADLTKKKAFDAIRFTLDYNPLVIDAVYAQVREGGNTITGGGTGAGGTTDNVNTLRSDDDVILRGINAKYDFGKMNTIGEVYLWNKKIGQKNFTTNKADVVNVLGARVSTEPIENLTYQVEGAYQFGTLNPGNYSLVYDGTETIHRKAWAIETSLNYDWKKVKYTPSANFSYAYFRGDRQDVYDLTTGAAVISHYRGWDPMFENQTYGRIVNAILPQTNMHIIGLAGSMKPREDMTLMAQYYYYLWDKKYQDGATTLGYYDNPLASPFGGSNVMKHAASLGQEIDMTLTYDYTEDVQFKLMSDLFFPGASFGASNNDAAAEVIGSMKVTF
ncbi:MAG: alginate export family protein [Candidatus Omnitrophica bacterium]|nr:alginate export family protein [Candidatus Omnitrophota bacterium]MDD5236608.1 alginate export family protein [Candidatus Omnitrophota bacterium]MDD5610435.1 alginate export family protein [Candidatus Omnitrophota bacterium]